MAQAAKQIVKARKPQSCALFSSQILRFSSRCPAFCSCVPVLCSGGQHSAPVSWYSAPVASHSTSGGPAFCLRCPTILLPVASHSTSRFPAILPPRPRTQLPQHILSPQRVTLPFPILLFSSQRSVLRYQSPLLPHPGQHPRYARTKTPILCSKRWEGGIGNRKSGVPANHRARFKNANTS